MKNWTGKDFEGQKKKRDPCASFFINVSILPPHPNPLPVGEGEFQGNLFFKKQKHFGAAGFFLAQLESIITPLQADARKPFFSHSGLWSRNLRLLHWVQI
jgi:hypothetical protein